MFGFIVSRTKHEAALKTQNEKIDSIVVAARVFELERDEARQEADALRSDAEKYRERLRRDREHAAKKRAKADTPQVSQGSGGCLTSPAV